MASRSVRNGSLADRKLFQTDPLPAPADPEIDEVARLLVRGERSGKSIRINITMDESLLAAIDRIAPNRSDFLAEAARVALAAKRGLSANRV